ncbi:MAG: putative transporter, partial [Bacteroidales bacterium]
MQFLETLFTSQTVVQSILLFCAVSAFGLMLGKIKIAGVSLGVTFVFFIGILAGHLGFEPNPQMLSFAQSFGLIIFVYALGLQVGPGFFASLKEGGVKLTMLASLVVVIGLILTVVFHYTFHISMA